MAHGIQSIYCMFPGPTRLSISNCISIGSAVLHSSRQRVSILYTMCVETIKKLVAAINAIKKIIG